MLDHRNATGHAVASRFRVSVDSVGKLGKIKAVERALKHPNGAEMSDNQIAEHCGVSQPFVGNVRKKLPPTYNDYKSVSDADAADIAVRLGVPSPRKGADGRTINTSNIGHGKKDVPFDQVAECAKLEKGIFAILDKWPRRS